MLRRERFIMGHAVCLSSNALNQVSSRIRNSGCVGSGNFYLRVGSLRCLVHTRARRGAANGGASAK